MTEKPDWVIHSREKVAQETDYAASIHYSVLISIEEAETEAEKEALRASKGNEAWQNRWFTVHSEAAWYTRHPEVK